MPSETGTGHHRRTGFDRAQSEASSRSRARSAGQPGLLSASSKLLARLPIDDYRRVFAQTTHVPLKLRQVLYEQGQRIEDVYFPGEGTVCSLTRIMEDGAMAEVA